MLNRLIILITIILVSCTSRQGHNNQVTAEPQVIPGFNIEFPQTAFKVEKTESTDRTLDNIIITNWILQGADDNENPFMYFVAHNKMPENLKNNVGTIPGSLNLAFRAMLTGSATKLGGKDFEFTPVKYQQWEGMESICKVFDGDGIIKSRVYLIDEDIFMISAGGRKIDIRSVDKFLDSFSLK